GGGGGEPFVVEVGFEAHIAFAIDKALGLVGRDHGERQHLERHRGQRRRRGGRIGPGGGEQISLLGRRGLGGTTRGEREQHHDSQQRIALGHLFPFSGAVFSGGGGRPNSRLPG